MKQLLTPEQRSALIDLGEAVKIWWQEPPSSRASFDRATRALDCLSRAIDAFANPLPDGKTPDWAKSEEQKPADEGKKKPGRHVN
jgi:hypothetical protein